MFIKSKAHALTYIAYNQWPCEEPIDWRYLPYEAYFDTYFFGNIRINIVLYGTVPPFEDPEIPIDFMDVDRWYNYDYNKWGDKATNITRFYGWYKYMRITIGGTRLLCLQSNIISNGFINQLIISYSWGATHRSSVHSWFAHPYFLLGDLLYSIPICTMTYLNCQPVKCWTHLIGSPPSFHTSHPAHAASTAKTAAVKAIGLRQGAGSNGEYTHSMAIFIRKINEHWVILQWN